MEFWFNLTEAANELSETQQPMSDWLIAIAVIKKMIFKPGPAAFIMNLLVKCIQESKPKENFTDDILAKERLTRNL